MNRMTNYDKLRHIGRFSLALAIISLCLTSMIVLPRQCFIAAFCLLVVHALVGLWLAARGESCQSRPELDTPND